MLFAALASGFFSFAPATFAAPVCACFFSGGGCDYAEGTTSSGACNTACQTPEVRPPSQTVESTRWDGNISSEAGTGIVDDCRQAQDAVAATEGQAEKNICTCFLTPKGCQEVIGNAEAVNQSSCDLKVCKEDPQIKNRYSGESGWNANVKTDAGKMVRNLCSAGIVPSSLPSDAPAPSTILTPPTPKPFITPQLNVQIPDLDFSNKISQKNGVIEVSFLSEYIGAVYKFLLGAAVTIAIVMIMIGGFQYVLGSGGFGDVKKGKERIKNAITGLILLMGVSLILSTVNPNLVLFKPLLIEYIKPSPWVLQSIEENLQSCGTIKGSVKPCSATKLTAPNRWKPELVDAVNKVSAQLGVDPFLVAAHLQSETNGDAEWGVKRGPCGEIGPVQFMPTTFDSTLKSGTKCCTAISRKNNKASDQDKSACGEVVAWPPPADKMPCKPDICSNCQQANFTCMNDFNTVTDGKIDQAKLEKVVNAEAMFIKTLLNNSLVKKDIASAMCAYNGSGKKAAEYAQKTGKTYADFCKLSGGTQ